MGAISPPRWGCPPSQHSPRHARPDFERRTLAAFHVGAAERPDTTFGTVDDDVIAHCDKEFRRTDFTELILDWDWPE